MNKEYTTINFTLGNSIEDAVNELLAYKEKGILACGEFNKHILYSDTVTMDGAYKEITGKTKAEFDKAQKERIDNYQKEEKEHKEIIPKLTEMWIERGKEVLTEDNWEYWSEIVPIRLNDMYRGMELKCCLDIVELLNDNCTLEEAKKEIESQDHSGMSHSLVCAMVKEFCERGTEFVEYAR